MDFTATVRARMAEENTNITDLAHKMGISVQHASALLKGRRRWNETTMTRACQALGLKADFIPEKTGSDVAANQ